MPSEKSVNSSAGRLKDFGIKLIVPKYLQFALHASERESQLENEMLGSVFPGTCYNVYQQTVFTHRGRFPRTERPLVTLRAEDSIRGITSRPPRISSQSSLPFCLHTSQRFFLISQVQPSFQSPLEIEFKKGPYLVPEISGPAFARKRALIQAAAC